MENRVQLFAAVGNMDAALQRSYCLAGLCDKEAAALCDIDYCHFQRMLRQGDGRHFPPNKIELLLKGCGNTFALEWLAWRFGMALYPLELAEVLKDIRAALAGNHHHVRFIDSGLGTGDSELVKALNHLSSLIPHQQHLEVSSDLSNG